MYNSGPLLMFQETAPCFALEVVKVANRSTKLPLNLLTMKTTTAHPSAASGGAPGAGLGTASPSAYSFTAASDTSSLMPPNTKASYSMELRSVSFTPSIPSSEVFFFGPKEDSTFCCLCAEDIEPPFTQRMHVAASSRASHTNHTCREVALDHLALLGIRGYPLDHMYAVWSDVLYQNPIFPRIPELTSPLWSWEERAAALLPHLKLLREMKVLDICLAGVAQQNDTVDIVHSRRRVAFERVEYIGDCAWGNHVANRLMILYPNEQWLYSERVYNFNCMRDAVEMNITLELLFDSLHLTDLLPSRCVEHVGSGKIKADVVEAVLGELHCNVWGLQPEIVDDAPFVEVNGEREDSLLALVQHCLTEMYDLLVLGYARELSWNAIPIAKSLAARNLWMETQPQLRLHKSGRRHWNRPRAGAIGAMGMSNAVFNSYSFNQAPAVPSPTTQSSLAANVNLFNPTLSGTGSFLTPTSPLPSPATPPPSTAGISSGGAETALPSAAMNQGGEAQTSISGARDEKSLSTSSSSSSSHGAGEESSSKRVAFRPGALSSSMIGGVTSSGARFTLPGLPRLHDAATPYPSHAPHPLLLSENQPPLSFHDRAAPAIFHARQRLTSFEYTGGDVFSAFHKSFVRLGLLKDDTRQVFHFVKPAAAMQKYLHDVAPAAAAAAGVAAPAGSVIRWMSAEETGVFFRDPFYHLPQQAHVPEQLTTTEEIEEVVGPEEMDDHETIESRDSSPSTPTETTAKDNKKKGDDVPSGISSSSPSSTSPAIRRTTTVTHVWSGVQRGAAIATLRRPESLRNPLQSVSLALQSAFPLLQADSGVPDGDADADSDDGEQHDVIRGQWKRSRWVPPGVKPPTVGVINDQHPLHYGAFAYLAVGISRPFRVALGHLAKKKKDADIVQSDLPTTPSGESTTAKTVDDIDGKSLVEKVTTEVAEDFTSSTVKGPSAVPSDTSHTFSSPSTANEEESSSPPPSSSRGEDAMDEIHNEDESALRSVTWEYWSQKSREKWMQDNGFFTQRFTVLSGKERMNTTVGNSGSSSSNSGGGGGSSASAAPPSKPSRLTPVAGAASIPIFRVKKTE